MPRIRTIKPEFFRHEKLQDLEIENPGSYCMLVFIGLWTQCDNQGTFIYKPRQLKLDILPFIDFDMENTLSLLNREGLIKKYSVNGKHYGNIPTLPMHQRFSGKEAGEAGKKFPTPYEGDREVTGKQQGSNGEAIETDQSFTNVQEREREKEKEREKEREQGKGKEGETPPSVSPCPHQKIIEKYHEILPELPRVQSANGFKDNLKSRWREDKARQKIEWWETFFETQVKTSDFLMGRAKDWQCNLSWIVGPKNFSKILNGQYINRGYKTGTPLGDKNLKACEDFVNDN